MEEANVTKLYIGNLPWAVTALDLNELFSSVGTVLSTDIAIDRETGRSKGFGFIEMEDADMAQNAIDYLDGALLGDRPIKVKPKRETR